MDFPVGGFVCGGWRLFGGDGVAVWAVAGCGDWGVRIEGGNANLSMAERLYLQAQLSLQAEALQEPAGSGLTPVTFTISPGETAVTIATNLQTAGMLENPDLFLTYARFYGLDSQLEAGEFTLSPVWTIPELALTLTKAIARDVGCASSKVGGWRRWRTRWPFTNRPRLTPTNF
ncbi:MAG: hypothetical protein M5U34_20875 [Chloroflexi bacterium]|nr:hypothetical protein [Chloroflexota bacterium]